MTHSCNQTSVGILVLRDDQLLLIERRNPPYGWAPPAGHVDAGESYLAAAHRELTEEVGLRARSMQLLLVAGYDNRCRRPGGDFHHWQVFQAQCAGEPVRSEEETRSMRWVSCSELKELSEVSVAHLDAAADPATWQAKPGLEPVWLTIFGALAREQ